MRISSFEEELVEKAEGSFRRDVDYMVDALSGEFGKLQGHRILVTGGAGFVGYYLAHAALAWNRNNAEFPQIRLKILDNFVRGVPQWLSDLQEGEGSLIELHEVDISTLAAKDVPASDYIFHAASIASPTAYRDRPIETMDANVKGIRTLLEHCYETQDAVEPVKGLLFFSSSEIYGDPDPDNIPTTEDYWGNVSCIGPRASYDESKRFGETLCVNYAREYGAPVKIVRPFNNYGPGMSINDGRLVADIAKNIINNDDIVLYSDGSSTRTFCYITDAIVGYYRILINGIVGHPYNIGSEYPEISVDELASIMANIGREMFAYTGSIVHEVSSDSRYNLDSPRRRCPSIGRARQELGYVPKIELEDGLARTLLWCWATQRSKSRVLG